MLEAMSGIDDWMGFGGGVCDGGGVGGDGGAGAVGWRVDHAATYGEFF